MPLYTHPWPGPLVEARLLGRRNRFLADVEFPDRSRAVAHCVNTGAMEGLVVAGARVWLTHSGDPKRQLAWTWRMMELEPGLLVGTDTSMPNRIVGGMLEARALRGFAGYTRVVAERRLGTNSRVDFHLARGRREHFLEVKNCHLVYPDGGAYFPDSVSERATHHLAELEATVRAGHRATVLFTVQRNDVRRVRPSDLHDPAFAQAARRAAQNGVEFMALRIEPALEGLLVHATVPVDLAPYETRRIEKFRAALKPASGWRRGPAPDAA
jgi:sugar fermentation stimulation protein A